MWGRLLAVIQAYMPRDIVEICVFLLCACFTVSVLANQAICTWYIVNFPLTPVDGRCGTAVRKDFMEAMTTLVTLLIAFLSGKRTGYNNRRDDDDFKRRDDED